MVIKTIVLSGFEKSDSRGKIEMETDIMTPAARNLAASGQLCRADVRFLDDAFRAAPSSYKITNIAYLRDSILQERDAGRHLFSILTGRHIYEGPGEKVFKIDVVTKPRMKVEKGMSFPNNQGLYGYQADSAYGTLCRGWKVFLSKNENTPGMTTKHLLELYRNIIKKNTTLCEIEKKDVYALCYLYCRAFGHFVGTSAGYAFPTVTSPPSQKNILLSMECDRKALDIGRNVPGFSGLNISPSYGQNAFPARP